MNKKFIFKSNGIYLGFVREDGFIFSRDGDYLGWLEEEFAWDNDGQFRGRLKTINENNYILRDMYSVPPLPKNPRNAPAGTSSIQEVKSNISPIILPIGHKDGF